VRRSIELTDGNRGPIFGVVLLLGLAQFLAGMAAAIGFEVAAGIQPEPLGYSLTIIAITILFGVFQSTMAAVAYSLLRKGRENVDIEELAAVFA
jgi:membrane-bound ClpP family serine protease